MKWLAYLLCLVLLLLSAADARAVTIPTVPVGNPGNGNDPLPGSLYSGLYGGVAYAYRIGTTEVTNAQYAAFLNEKAKSDPLALYSAGMAIDPRGGITQSGLSPNFSYAPKTDMGNKPVNFVSWYDSIRFANWLNNGQGAGDTETGAYTIFGPLNPGGDPVFGYLITRNAGATWFLPSENEWYKAAYYQPAAQGGDADNYWSYPTKSNSAPTLAAADSVGNISNPGANVANYRNGADWNGQDGNVTTVGSAGSLSDSFYGTVDQAGNVWEWTETLDHQYTPDFPILRGGSFGEDAPIDFISSAVKIANPPNGQIELFGFRVASVLEPGDANSDGLVDGADYTSWADHYLQTGQSWKTGDFTGDGLVDAGDYTIWADHYAPAVATVAPEPSTFVLAAVGVLALVILRKRRRSIGSAVALLALALFAADARAVTIPTVPVGNPGNAPDQNYADQGQFGAVPNGYRIAIHEVTNADYAAFLNANVSIRQGSLFLPPIFGDPASLLNSSMLDDPRGGIETYSTACVGFLCGGGFGHPPPPPPPRFRGTASMYSKPVNFVSWYDAARYVNWLNNGQGSGSTETGAYAFGPLGNGGVPVDPDAITRNPGATWFLPNEDEWYKAAYYQPAAEGGDSDGYWLSPTRSNAEAATFATANSSGNISNPGANVMNESGASWNGQTGNVTTVGSAGPLSGSFYGTYDQGGNVQEWTESAVSGGRIVRGGSWDGANNIGFRADQRTVLSPSYEGADLGFRVATILPLVTGDVNWDDVVDGVDYSVWADHYLGTVQNWTNGDLNGNGFVDGGDYTIWADHFAPVPGAAAAIPEPSAFALAAMGVAGLILWRWRRAGSSCFVACVAVIFCNADARAVTIPTVPVGNPGNAPDTRYNSISVGSVANVYQIGKYEVTAGQYTEFLNAVADADPNGLYNTNMVNSLGANIQQSGSSPNYSYSVAADWANRPVNYVSFWDAARFANWLHNGQPIGPQGPGTTEDGAYHDVGNQAQFGRSAGARFFIPSEDEWYKAAYHDMSAGLAASYFNYPTGTNVVPGNDINETTNPGNNVNYLINNYAIGSPYWRTVAGEFELSDSPYGTFDQGGNVWEWNETAVNSSLRGLLGGSFDDGFVYSWYLLASYRGTGFPSFENDGTGFRVAGVLEPGDANSDGLVDGSDYTAWADHYLQTGQSWKTGDFTGDGLVNGADYTIWADHYAPAGAASAVPEPSTICLAGIGALALLARRSSWGAVWKKRLPVNSRCEFSVNRAKSSPSTVPFGLDTNERHSNPAISLPSSGYEKPSRTHCS